MDDRSAIERNRAHWEALAAVHGPGTPGGYYDVDALVGGRDSLHEAEDAAVGDVRGLDVLHVQCHVGFDTISLARRGARVTGTDFSPASLAAAADLAGRCDVAVEWVEAESTALPRTLHGRFDVAYATIGVIAWIEDLGAWMRSVAATLRPGGRLVLVDLHPVLCMFASVDPLVVDFPYAFDGPRRFDEPGSYADPDADVAATETVEFAHGLGEIVTAALDAGLRLDGLAEHLSAEYDPRGHVLTREDDGRFRLRLGGEPIPLLFALRASRPA